MTELSSWILSILIVVISGVVVDLMLSGGRLHKFVRGVVALTTMLVVLMPLPKVVGAGFSLSLDSSGQLTMDQGYLDAVGKIKLNALEDGVEAMLAEAGIQGASVKIMADFVADEIKIGQVSVDLQKSVLDPSLGNINKNELVIKLVCQHLNTSRGNVIVYG